MGACCSCCAQQAEVTNSSPFHPYPRVSQERTPLSLHHGAASVLPIGHLVDANLDTSIQETYRPPPAPIPYETYAGHPRTPPGNREGSGSKTGAAVQPINSESVEESNSHSTLETTTKDLKETDGKVKPDIELASCKEVENEVEKSGDLKKSSQPIVSSVVEEEDVCPTCLEEYDAENPKIMTKCKHHFHLACILEWMERSDTCPVCDQEMIF